MQQPDGETAPNLQNSRNASQPGPPSSVEPHLVRAMTAWLIANGQEILTVVSIAALCLIRRIETLEPVNSGGDAAIQWQFVREWFYKHDFAHVPWNHHMTRFGVLVPTYLAQCLSGHGLRAYYTAPLAACVVQAVFVYACGRRLLGSLAGILAALLLIYTRLMATAGSQILPDLFTGTYAIVMMYLYLRFADATGRSRMGWLVGCALLAFAGYLAKETMFFFYPGMALAIWLAGRKPRELLIFAGILLLGLAVETAAYRVFTDYHSRFAIVFASHRAPGSNGTERADTTFWKLFERYQHIDKPWIFAFHVFLPCWVGLLGFTRNFRVRALLAVVASFFFCLTFLVRNLSPMLLWQRFMSRYLDPAAPFVELVTALFVALALEQMWQQRRDRLVWRQLARLTPFRGALVLVVSAGLGLWSYSDMKEDIANHAFTAGTKLAAITDDTYRRNLPIVIRMPRSHNDLYARDVETLYAIYMDTRDLVRDGRLPPFAEAKRVSGSMTYLVRDPALVSATQVSHLMDAGCALEIRETTPFMAASLDTTLPPSCDALVSAN